MNERNFFKRLLRKVSSIFRRKCTLEECMKLAAERGIFCYKDEGRTEEMLTYPELIEMLKTYDETRIEPLENALGYEDTRVNTFNFEQFKKYLGHIENMSKKAKIKISGISFITGAKMHEREGKEYSGLIYMPTTMVDGNEVLFDPVQSARRGQLVTLREMLEQFGYNWIYDNKETYMQGKRKDNNNSLKSVKTEEKMMTRSMRNGFEEESGAGNYGQLTPPYSK